jgi:secondary thiamine-phosphate synthase enzyme
MVKHYPFTLKAKNRGFHLITTEILEFIGKLPTDGILNLFIQHTSAGLTINENADATVRKDFEASLNHIVKENEPFYEHTLEGSDDMPAHIKSTLTGHSLSIPIVNGNLALGTWQGIYLCEFRNSGGNRRVIATIYN